MNTLNTKLNAIKSRMRNLNYEPDAGLLPEIWFNVSIYSVEWKERSKSDMVDLNVTFAVLDGEHSGHKKAEKYILLDTNAGQRHSISKNNFGQLLNAIDIAPITDADDVNMLEGKQLQIHIKHSPSKTTGRVFENINGYKKLA